MDSFKYICILTYLNTSHLHALKDMIIWKEKIFKMHRQQIYEWNIKKLGLAILQDAKIKNVKSNDMCNSFSPNYSLPQSIYAHFQLLHDFSDQNAI